jgi:triphosphatase
VTSRDESSAAKDREVEWQLHAPDLGAVRRWLEAHRTVDGLAIEARPTVHNHDIYFDTDDWRIFRAGFSLRLRSNSNKREATLKAIQSARQDVADRREMTEALHGEDAESTAESLRTLHGDVGKHVRAVAGNRLLRPLFEVRTHRQRFALHDQQANSAGETPGGKEQQAEVALDETAISPPNASPQASLQRVEVEAFGENHAPIEKLVKLLCAECGLAPSTESKFAAGLKAAGLAPTMAPQYTPTVADAFMRVDEVALASLRSQWCAWIQHESGARFGEDPEELHVLRVSARRMHAALDLFEPYLDDRLLSLRGTLNKLLDTFGAVRDLDLQLLEITQFARQLPAAQCETLQPLIHRLEAERGKARARMLRLMDAQSTERWTEKLTQILVQPPPATESAAATAVAPMLIRSRYRKLRKAADRLTPFSSLDDYHKVRGRSKKLRYAVEAFAPIYGKPAQDMLRVLRRMQERLGRMQDAHVANTRMIALATDARAALPTGTVFAMGRYAERRAMSVEKLRARFDKAYRKVRGKRWKALRTALLAQPATDQQPAAETAVAAAESPAKDA